MTFQLQELRALDVILDADGNPACRSAVDGTDPNCVPWNVFINNGNQIVDDPVDGVTQAALDYLIVDLYEAKFMKNSASSFIRSN